MHVLPSPDDVPVHDNVRGDLLELLATFRAMVDISKGTTFQVLKAEAAAGKSLLTATVRARVTDPLKELIYQALARGAERGEVRPAAVTRHIALVGPRCSPRTASTRATTSPTTISALSSTRS